jgi:glutaminyl-peptide cyclotransferase
MLLDLAETLNPLLDQRKERLEAGHEDDEDVSDTTLQLVFFDGEEAYGNEWTATNSIYGARSRPSSLM